MERTNIKISSIDGIMKKGTNNLLGYNLIEKVATPYGDKAIKYGLWLTKKDGTETKAFTQFKSKGIQIGNEVEVCFKEEEREFQYKDKTTGEQKTGKTMNRTIMYFPDPEPEGQPVIQPVDYRELTKEPTKESFDKDIEKFGEEVRNREFDTSKIPF